MHNKTSIRPLDETASSGTMEATDAGEESSGTHDAHSLQATDDSSASSSEGRATRCVRLPRGLDVLSDLTALVRCCDLSELQRSAEQYRVEAPQGNAVRGLC